MDIRILQTLDTTAYHALRLSALKINPEAFGSTYEKEVTFSTETVMARLTPSEDQFVIGAFAEQAQLAGIVTFMREKKAKTAHKANVYGMYVAPPFRGQGIAKALMLALMARAKSSKGLEQLHLAVVTDNISAIKLYQELGFELYGVEPNALKFNGNYSDENLMALKL
ncbi:GNAT family N-acetyltransferase [Paenibacillus sp. BIHB 4019]|uniref:GNAT family N-acetyltransferase n=1 Tax=Paenibacillus sp. BIHB 4019 TaxID=1870819 RepID=A0A1B2DL12_9BACL|nr:GNAT family N-acetyltransferase [Paenibacillus sp. BIHB 4019]ANY68392.1 GNAT family N-acetyltransferase [Paenibacillus sp. BIHB 4019]